MAQIVERVIIEPDDAERLRRAFIHRSGMLALLNEKTAPTERDYEVFSEKHAHYESVWDDILQRYFPGKYRTGNYRWACDFISREVVITG